MSDCPLCCGEGIVWAADRLRAWDCPCASGMPLREDPKGLRPKGLRPKAGSPVPKGDAQ
jgi:hypothetical protein